MEESHFNQDSSGSSVSESCIPSRITTKHTKNSGVLTQQTKNPTERPTSEIQPRKERGFNGFLIPDPVSMFFPGLIRGSFLSRFHSTSEIPELMFRNSATDGTRIQHGFLIADPYPCFFRVPSVAPFCLDFIPLPKYLVNVRRVLAQRNLPRRFAGCRR